MNEHELKCKHCGRYMGKVASIIGTLPCPNSSCKGETQFKIVTTDVSKAISYKFSDTPKAPKQKEIKQ